MDEQEQGTELQRGITIGGGQTQSSPELQGILVQLGRIADQLQEMAKELKGSGTQKPQPFGGQT